MLDIQQFQEQDAHTEQQQLTVEPIRQSAIDCATQHDINQLNSITFAPRKEVTQNQILEHFDPQLYFKKSVFIQFNEQQPECYSGNDIVNLLFNISQLYSTNSKIRPLHSLIERKFIQKIIDDVVQEKFKLLNKFYCLFNNNKFIYSNIQGVRFIVEIVGMLQYRLYGGHKKYVQTNVLDEQIIFKIQHQQKQNVLPKQIIQAEQYQQEKVRTIGIGVVQQEQYQAKLQRDQTIVYPQKLSQKNIFM